MKLFVVLALCVASGVAAPGYGAPQIRFRSYNEAPVVREAPIYNAPAIRAEPLPVQEIRQAYAPVQEIRQAYAPVEVKQLREFVPIVKYRMDDDNYGSYNLDVQTADGQFTSETGSLKNGPEGAVNVKQGEYSYTIDGQTFTTRWIADENGFRAFGDHLPTSPPMPEDIRKSLEMPRVALVDDYSAPAVRVQQQYEAPIVRVAEPVVRVQQYEAPAPIVRVQQQYEAPVVRVAEPVIRVQQYEAPAPIVRVQQQYEAPVVRVAEPIVRVQQYEAPAPVVRFQQQYEAPVVRVQQYDAPAPVVRVQQQYEAPVVRVQQYDAPAPVVRVAPTSYEIRSEGY